MADMNDPDTVVFVVDDDELILKEVVDSIHAKKISVAGFSSGNKAFEAIKARTMKLGSHKIKLIICDWMMPDGDGITLLNKLRENEIYSSIPFILMSGAVTKDQLDGALKHDPDGIMLKPFGLQILPERMRIAIDLRDKKELEKLMANSGL